MYGCGQWRYTYQGREIIEHGGNNPGFKSQVARFPNDNLGIIAFSNDANGGIIMESVKWRIAEEILGLREIDWNARYNSLATRSSCSLTFTTGTRKNTTITGT